EDLPEVLDRGADDVELAPRLPGQVELDVEAETLGHRGPRHDVDVVRRLGRGETTDRVHRRLRAGEVTTGREVRELVVVAREAQRRGFDRVELGEPQDVVLGDCVDWGRFSRRLGHGFAA